jgi:hypothetical protein
MDVIYFKFPRSLGQKIMGLASVLNEKSRAQIWQTWGRLSLAAVLATSVSILWRITGKIEQITDYDLNSVLYGLQALLPPIV